MTTNSYENFIINKALKKNGQILQFAADHLKSDKDVVLEAVKQDGLIWKNHVSDLKGWHSVGASNYKISSIPQTFLIDKNGIIIDMGLRGTQLESRLKELL